MKSDNLHHQTIKCNWETVNYQIKNYPSKKYIRVVVYWFWHVIVVIDTACKVNGLFTIILRVSYNTRFLLKFNLILCLLIPLKILFISIINYSLSQHFHLTLSPSQTWSIASLQITHSHFLHPYHWIPMFET